MSALKILFRKGLFIAVRHANGWWLAQLYTHIFDSTEKVRIRWFNEEKNVPNGKFYSVDECNDIPAESVLTSVRVKRVASTPLVVCVSHEEIDRVNSIYEESLRYKKSKTENSKQVNKVTSKRKLNARKIPSITKSGQPLATKRKKVCADKASTQKVKKRKLTCYPNVMVYESDPLLELNFPISKIPKVAPTVDSLLYVRAAKNRQYSEIQRLQSDRNSLSFSYYSVNQYGYCNKIVSKSAWHYAVDNQDKKMLKLLYDEDNSQNRITGTRNYMNVVDTGTYNPASLGVERIRPLTMARGSREGVQAFQPIHFDGQSKPFGDSIVKYAIKQGCDLSFVKFLVSLLDNKKDPALIGYFKHAVHNANLAVAGGIVKESLASGADKENFNKLMCEVLTFTRGEKLSPFKGVSCHKRTDYYWGRISALHLAALNPNPLYLKKMLQAHPDLDIEDGSGFKLIHYAAIASTASATKLLLESDVNPLTTTNRGITPLMRAAQKGSVENIKALIGFGYAEHFESKTPGPLNTTRIVDIDLIKSVTKAAGGGTGSKNSKSKGKSGGEDEEGEEGDGEPMMNIKNSMRMKQGIGGTEMTVQKGNLSSYTALTMAVECGQGEAVKVLLDLGADPNKSIGAAKRKMAPLHIAAKYGFLDIMKTLILHGAKTRAKDRHGLTAFHYAAKYNQLHCLSWLAAHCVPDADIVDSSGNTALQYASAGGCILVVKYLVEELKVDVTIKNSWGMTALELALLRQQMGVLDYLISSTNADLNFRDNTGATVLMKFCSENMNCDPCKCLVPVNFLLDQSGVDVLAVDNNGCNALHYVAAQQHGRSDRYDQLLTRLLSFGLDINSKTNNDKTALLIATSAKWSLNFELVSALIKHGAEFTDLRFDKDRNIVQHFAASPYEKSTLTVLEVIVKTCDANSLQEMISHRDEEGLNALHILLISIFEKKRYNRSSSSPDPWKTFELLIGEKFGADINSEVTKRKISEKAKCSCQFKEEVHTKNCPLYPYTLYGKFRPLNIVMKLGDKEDIQRILSLEPDLNYVDCSGMYPLHHAVTKGNTDLVRQFLERGALTDVLPEHGEARDNFFRDYPVLVMAAIHCIGLIPMLVEAGACVLATDPDGKNVLHHIVSSYSDFHKRISIIEQLLPSIEKMDEVDGSGNSYLHLAISGIEHGSNISIEIISMLLMKGADPNLLNSKGQTPLHFAFLNEKSRRNYNEFSDPIEVVSILTNVMKKKFILAPDTYHGFTPLHLSAMRGGSVTSMHLIFHGCDVNALDNQGNTPLTLAINGKHQSCVLMLIEKGASIDRSVMYPIFRREPQVTEHKKMKVDEEVKYQWLPLTENPLHAPPEQVQNNMVLYKVFGYEWQGVAFKLVDLLGQSFVPLAAAIEMQKFNLAITLLLKFGKKVNVADSNDKGQTLVHCLALSPKQEEKLQNRLLGLLTKFKHSVSSKDTSYKCTPLHYSCLLNKFEMSKVLLKQNTINSKDNFGRTPLNALYWNGYPEEDFVQYLVENGASLENTCDFNIQESDYPLFDHDFSSNRSDYFTQFDIRYTVLIKSVIENKPKSVDLLLKLGANVNTPDNRGMTPLMHAAKMIRNTIFLKLLSSSTASIDSFCARSEEGKTVLHYAIISLPNAHPSIPFIFNQAITFIRKLGVGKINPITDIADNDGKTVKELCMKYPIYMKILGFDNGLENSSTNIEYMDLDCTEKDFVADCKKYFDDVHDLAARMKTKRLAVPDSCLSLDEDECEVYQDEQGVYYDMLMTKIDIKSRFCSYYNFYKLQLIRNKGKDLYLLLTKWGRIGDEGQHQETPFPTLEECKNEYMKVFKAKTKNDWKDVDNFVQHPMKYRLVSRDRRYYDQYKNIEYDMRPEEIPEHFDNKVFNILLEASDVKNVAKYLEDDFQLNASRLAMGFIEPETVAKADAVLCKLKDVFEKSEDLDSYDFSDSSALEKYTSLTQETYDLTNELYHLIPQKGYSVTRIQPIRRSDDIEHWEDVLTNIKNMEVVNKILAASQLSKHDIHPIQYIYSCLNCKIEPMDPKGDMTQYLMKNVYAACNNNNMVKGIFKLTPMKSDTRPQSRKVLMYHGIHAGTLLSILRRGLQHAPYGMTHGNRYGDGIYLADNISKSLSYASGMKSRFVLVVSVHLGNVYADVRDRTGSIPDDVNTIWKVGTLQQRPKYNVVLDGNLRMGMGKFETVNKHSFVLHCPKTGRYDQIEGTRIRNYYEIRKFVFGNTDDDDDSGDGVEEDGDKDEDEFQEPYFGENEETRPRKKRQDDVIMDDWMVRDMPTHNEFIIRDSNNIRLEYLIQI